MPTSIDRDVTSAESQPVKTYGRLHTLCPGQITPTGWLSRYAELTANSWLLRYAQNQDPEVYGKFWRQNRNTRATAIFSEKDETLVLSDYTAYFADSMMHFAALLPQSELAQHVESWVQQILESQDPDGYIGAFPPHLRWQNGLDVFSQCIALEALLYHYEAAGDERLLTACEREVQLQMEAWYKPNPQVKLDLWGGHGTISIRAYLKLYALTQNEDYLQFARDVMAKYGRTQEFLKGGDAIMYHHNAVGSEHVGFPVSLYEYTGDSPLLEASCAAWDMEFQNHISVDGTPHGNETMLFKGPLHNCEHCGTVEWFYSSNLLARISGDVKYADAAERAMLNAYPAAKSPDGMTVAYMHTPNQLVATEWSQPHGWTSPDWCASRQHYHSAHEPLCCNANGPRGLAYYIESMVMQASTGLAVVYYGPCIVHTTLANSDKVALVMDTDYPFEDVVTLIVTPEHATEFDLFLRVPGWCQKATLTINGEDWQKALVPGEFACVHRMWQPGDRLTLWFECGIRFERWERSEFGLRAAGVAVLRGPLTYTLPVKESWQRFDPPARGPGKDVVAYRVMPEVDAAWNYALALLQTQPQDSFTPMKLPVPADSRPWEHAPIGLKVKARKVLNWQLFGDAEHPMTPLMPFNPMQLDLQDTEITLVPFGFTHLRMTFLPVV